MYGDVTYFTPRLCERHYLLSRRGVARMHPRLPHAGQEMFHEDDTSQSGFLRL
jgi:hypothetical protein